MYSLHGNTPATGKTAATLDEAIRIARRHICIMPAREAELRERFHVYARERYCEGSIVYGFAEIHIVRNGGA